MDEKTKKEIKVLMVQSLVEVVVPALDKTNKRIDELEEKVVEFKDNLMTKMDSVYGEVLAMRQEQSVHQGEHNDINDRLDEIERIPVIAHSIRK